MAKTRRIYTKVVIDMKTGKTVSEDSFLYSGPLALCDGEGPTEEQIAAAHDAMTAAGITAIDNWRDALPEDIATHAGMEKFNGKGFDEVVKSYLNLEGKLGANPIVRPGDDADDDAWASYYGALGRPDDENGYEIGPPGDLPEGMNYNEDYEKEFRAEAHKFGLTNPQAKAVWDFIQSKATGGYQSAVDAHQQRLAEAAEALKKEWGAAHSERMQLINRASIAAEKDVPGLNDWLRKSGAGAEPMVQRLVYALSKNMTEDDLGPGASTPTLSPAEAKSKINAIMGDPKSAYRDPTHPGHQEAIEAVAKLHELAFPEA